MSIQDYAYFAREQEQEDKRKEAIKKASKFKRGDTVKNITVHKDKIGVVEDINIFNDSNGAPLYFYKVKYPEYDFALLTEEIDIVREVSLEETRRVVAKATDGASNSVLPEIELIMLKKDYELWIHEGKHYAKKYSELKYSH